MKKKGKNVVREIVLQRMHRLTELAELEVKTEPERAKKYVELIEKLSSHNKVKIPKEVKAKYCKYCKSFWQEKDVKKRLKTGKEKRYLTMNCLKCGKLSKIAWKKN
ncbi:MAG: hypothetical protein ABH821_05015 [archaeon]